MNCEYDCGERNVEYISNPRKSLILDIINPDRVHVTESMRLRRWSLYLGFNEGEKVSYRWCNTEEQGPEYYEKTFGSGWSNPQIFWVSTQDQQPHVLLNDIIGFIRPPTVG